MEDVITPPRFSSALIRDGQTVSLLQYEDDGNPDDVEHDEIVRLHKWQSQIVERYLGGETKLKWLEPWAVYHGIEIIYPADNLHNSNWDRLNELFKRDPKAKVVLDWIARHHSNQS